MIKVENRTFIWIISISNKVIMNFQNLSVHFCKSNEYWKLILFNFKKSKDDGLAFSTFILCM